MRLAVLVVIAACGSSPPPAPVVSAPGPETATAVEALRQSRFDDAGREASHALSLHPGDARAAAVRALATYRAAGDEVVGKLERVIKNAEHITAFDHEEGRAAWRAFADRLASVETDLAVVAADPQFSLELCLACWEHDWNHDGKIDDRDHKLFEIERDATGNAIPETDPRRRPTFRFDVGDAEWARAMVSFQRAFVELVLAYRWSDLDKLLYDGRADVTIRLVDKGRVNHARELILSGLAHAARCRDLYLAETDDDREWVPNPRQQSHPIPMPVDDALYQTWSDVIADVTRMLDSDEGISMRELATLVDKKAALLVPDAYVDLGKLLREPTDFSFDFKRMEPTPAGIEQALRRLLGHGYVEHAKASPLVGRLARMARELDQGGDTIEHKLRYLFWLN